MDLLILCKLLINWHCNAICICFKTGNSDRSILIIIIIIICSSYIALFLAKASSKRFTYYYPWQTCYIRHLLNSPGSRCNSVNARLAFKEFMGWHCLYVRSTFRPAVTKLRLLKSNQAGYKPLNRMGISTMSSFWPVYRQ